MSSMETNIHWFIARDGRQHGPVSDMEMRKLVELGHLRHNDLLWRQGFPDWRPAPAVFAASPAPQVPQPRERPQQHTASPTMMPRFEETAGRGASSGAAAVAAAAAAMHGTPMSNGVMQNGAAFSGGQQGAERRPSFGDLRSGPQFIPASQAAQPQRDTRFDASSTSSYRDPGPADQPEREGRRSSKRAAIAAVTVLALAGGGWYAAKNHGAAIKDMFAAKTSSTATATTEAPPSDTAAITPPPIEATAPTPSETQTALATPAALSPPPADKVQAIETMLQKAPYWNLIATEFPDWYRQKVDAAARLAAEGKSEADVNKNLVQSLVELRRNQADAALGASTETLKTLATAFKATVAGMAKINTGTCMSFILSGESNDAVIPVMTDPARNAEINAHMLAVFSAVAEGRKTMAPHADPADGDYKMLVAELVKTGWTQAELELFADPKGASRTTPERYCQMMQDFFAAHLTIPDPAVQDRLLHRTLKLVVAG